MEFPIAHPMKRMNGSLADWRAADKLALTFKTGKTAEALIYPRRLTPRLLPRSRAARATRYSPRTPPRPRR